MSNIFRAIALGIPLLSVFSDAAVADHYCEFPGCRDIERQGITSFANVNQRYTFLAANIADYERTFDKIATDLFDPDPRGDLLAVFPEFSKAEDIFQQWFVLFVVLAASDSYDFTFSITDKQTDPSDANKVTLVYGFTPLVGAPPKNSGIVTPGARGGGTRRQLDVTQRDYIILAIKKDALFPGNPAVTTAKLFRTEKGATGLLQAEPILPLPQSPP